MSDASNHILEATGSSVLITPLERMNDQVWKGIVRSCGTNGKWTVSVGETVIYNDEDKFEFNTSVQLEEPSYRETYHAITHYKILGRYKGVTHKPATDKRIKVKDQFEGIPVI